MGRETLQTFTLVCLAVCVAALLAGCSAFSFRLGELSFQGEPPEFPSGVESTVLK